MAHVTGHCNKYETEGPKLFIMREYMRYQTKSQKRNLTYYYIMQWYGNYTLLYRFKCDALSPKSCIHRLII